MRNIFIKLSKIIFVVIFLLNINLVFSEFNTKEINIKIEKVQAKILSSKKSDNYKIKIFSIIIKKLNNIERKINNSLSTEGFSPLKIKKKLKLVKYIKNDFKIKLLEFKTEKNLINKLVLNSEIGKVSNLKVLNGEFNIGNKNYFILRKFVQNKAEKYLIVEDETYNTFVIKSENILNKKDFGELFNKSSYKKNLDLVYDNRIIKKGKKYLQNAGLKSGLKKDNNNIYLTADFCPSKKNGFEDEIITKFIKKGNKNIAIAITSSWINGHKKDFQKLIEYNKTGKLNITWINHTKTHSYNFSNNFSTTFILTPNLVLENEILDVEKKLLENGQKPSVFLRFPGLISNEKIFKDVIYRYGLIPLGADTWLAKGEKIKPNSIILIHGNKNEHRGVEIFNKILDTKNNFYYDNINNSLKKIDK